MNYTPITPKLLLKLGFEKRKTQEGNDFFAKGKIALVNNSGWIPCKMVTGEPKAMEPIWNITTIEELYLLERRDGIEDIEIQDFLLQKCYQYQH